jgi:hypothetical protein
MKTEIKGEENLQVLELLLGFFRVVNIFKCLSSIFA